MIKLWSILWTIWSIGLLVVIFFSLSLNIELDPPNIYVFFTIGIFNGLVLLFMTFFPGLLGYYGFWQLNFVASVLVGLGQWFVFYQLGKKWLSNWQDSKWYRKIIFPIILFTYYGITGILSVFLFALASWQELSVKSIDHPIINIY